MDLQSLILSLAFFIPAHLFAAIPPLPPPGLGIQSFGVLVLGEGEAPQWTKTSEEIKSAFTARFPVEFAFGLADRDSLQHAISKLESQQVKKIIVVPLFFSSSARVMKQVRYLLGIGKKPSQGLFKTYQDLAGPPTARLDIHVPVVLMPTLDFSPALPQILLKHAESGSGNRKDKTLVLVSEAPSSSKNSKSWKMTLKGFADQIRKAAGFRKDAVFLLNEGLSQTEAQSSESSFTDSLRSMRLKGQIFIVPVELAPDLVTTRLSKMLSGLLVGYNDQTLLPDPLIISWVAKAAKEGAKLGDMRKFKDKPKLMSFPKMEE